MSSGSGQESKKTVAGILAILLGGFGVHKFYLGMPTPGIITLVLTVVTCGATGIIGLIEGIIYLTKTDEEFIRLYQSENPKQWF
jgi:TM2 domain-containing membrane protein YozV